jgi:hypothetical protein
MKIGYVGWCENYPCDDIVCAVCKRPFEQEEGQPDEYGHPLLYPERDAPIGTAVHNACFWPEYTREILSGELQIGQTIVADEEDEGIFLWTTAGVSTGNGVVHWMTADGADGSYFQLDSKVRILKEDKEI